MKAGLRIDGIPNAEGWVSCYSADRDERNPSARFNVFSGVYIDNGGDGKPISLRSLLVLLGTPPDDARRAAGGRRRRRFVLAKPDPRMPGWNADARRVLVNNPALLDNLAARVGLPAHVLDALGVGFEEEGCRWTFPMRDAEGAVIGVRTRTPAGAKRAFTNSRNGLFYPNEWAVDPPAAPPLLAVAEGPTDAAAFFAWGIPAVGRPSATGGVRHVCGLVKRLKPGLVAVFADADGPGRKGAADLAATLAPHGPACVLEPPPGVKDARDWFNRGGKPALVRASIFDAPLCAADGKRVK